ncbi:MAG: hypothetical protein D3923_11095 [Candidatus Electrothrix sp. AR3]|nr:hypothetical protein [Candidatus Electrothrix sp. AR3]
MPSSVLGPKKFFCYTLGGIIIKVTAEHSCFLEEATTSCQPSNFFCSTAPKQCQPTFQVHIRSQQQKYSLDKCDRIFTQKQTEFYKTATGYLQLFYQAGDKEIPRVQISSDAAFS